MISEDDWKSIEETLYLNQLHGMTESIISGSKESLAACKKYEASDE